MNTNLLKTALWPSIAGLLAAALIIVITNNNDAPTSKPETFSPNLSSYPKVDSYANAVDKASPAVVNIYTSRTVVKHSHPLFNDPLTRKLFNLKNMPQEKVQTGLGSGVLMNSQGYLLTNHHVVQGAENILVELRDKRQSQAQIIGIDPDTDLAVLKINLNNLPFINSAAESSVRVGDVALAIGNPLGIGQTVTMGIVSATGRNQLGLSTYENFIQTDAAINKGNSGGALIDANGNLIGINSAIFSNSGGSDGIGFAIPLSIANKVLNDIVNEGRVIRGWLGASFLALTPELANYLGTNKREGVVIVRILSNGPAYKAGILPGDLIVAINDVDAINENSALSTIAETKPGETIKIKLIRKNELISVEAMVGERPSVNERIR